MFVKLKSPFNKFVENQLKCLLCGGMVNNCFFCFVCLFGFFGGVALCYPVFWDGNVTRNNICSLCLHEVIVHCTDFYPAMAPEN